MPLTPENIAKINEFLEDHATLSRSALAEKWGAGNTLNSKVFSVANTITFLRRHGVDLKTKAGMAVIPISELAKFREWQAQQKRLAAE